MRIAIVHYHLGPGGVSAVIGRASRCLSAAGVPHVVLAGAPPEPVTTDLPLRIVPALAYADGAGNAESLLETVRSAAADALGAAPDIWHFHNHSLGKNPRVTDLAALLAATGERLVLQIHDLAEDGRPQNLARLAESATPYPTSPAIRYVFLNSRDREIFTRAGLPDAQSALLPNPVEVSTDPPPDRRGEPLAFAPVRGIRRKNLGEIVLLAALAPPGARFAISRAPLDPQARAIHDAWREFSARHRLPVEFDVVDRAAPVKGADAGFDSWVRHASHFVTTSVGEGFGMTFLESAAHGKPLIGRDLPGVTCDHAARGIHPGDLYERLLIPAEWTDIPLLRDHLLTTLERNQRLAGGCLPRWSVEEILSHIIHDGWLDFGNLPEPLQQGAIERLADPSSRQIPRVVRTGADLSASGWLAAALENREPATRPEQLELFTPARHGESLLSIYRSLTSQDPGPVRPLAPSAILAACARPEDFHFLRSAPPPPGNSKPLYKAVVFDIYGTLLIAPAGGVKPDPAADPVLREILRQAGHEPPQSPSTALHEAVRKHHAAAGVDHPEVDLRELWKEILRLDPAEDTTALVKEIEHAWHPSRPMPGAAEYVRRLSRRGVSLGLLSNAQCNTLGDLGAIRDLFPPELIVFSYRHGIAKPSPELFSLMAERLAHRGIAPNETLFVGNDPLHDIAPAAAAGFATALFDGHPDSRRPGECRPDHEIHHWTEAPL